MTQESLLLTTLWWNLLNYSIIVKNEEMTKVNSVEGHHLAPISCVVNVLFFPHLHSVRRSEKSLFLLSLGSLQQNLLHFVTSGESSVGNSVRLCYPKSITFKVHIKYHTQICGYLYAYVWVLSKTRLKLVTSLSFLKDGEGTGAKEWSRRWRQALSIYVQPSL